MSTSDSIDPSRLHAEAAHWVARRNLNAPSQTDEREFSEWLRLDVKHGIAYGKAEQAWKELRQLRGRTEFAVLMGGPTFRERMVAMARKAGFAVEGVLRSPVGAAVFAASLMALVVAFFFIRDVF